MNLTSLMGKLESFLQGSESFLWIVDEGIWWDDGEIDFETSLAVSDADLLSTMIRTRAQDPDWPHWTSLVDSEGKAPPCEHVACLLPWLRISRKAAELLLRRVGEGWRGHPEVLLPSVIHEQGLLIEDIGGEGSFTPPGRYSRWYEPRTWNWCGPVEHVPGKAHFPVPRNLNSPAEPRVLGSSQNSKIPEGYRLLYVSPVGRAATGRIEAAVKTFAHAGAEVLLLAYDDVDLTNLNSRVIRDVGWKWQLAFRHLKPEKISQYDFIFFWDDDLDIPDFNPRRFIEIMIKNRLDMAQPAIRSDYPLSHGITALKPQPPPWLDGSGHAKIRIVGRLTNFVEIMAPVFTKEAWREFFCYLNEENKSGWGYDYIPLSRKGIVDVLPVTHAREVQSGSAAAAKELRDFLNCQGLFEYPPVELGWLFEDLDSILGVET